MFNSEADPTNLRKGKRLKLAQCVIISGISLLIKFFGLVGRITAVRYKFEEDSKRQ